MGYFILVGRFRQNLNAGAGITLACAPGSWYSQACEPGQRNFRFIPGRPPHRQTLSLEDINPRYLNKILLRTYERAPQDFEGLLSVEGVGPLTLRALALASELIYGTSASTRDPARFAFAHGGKDGTPFPVDRVTYEHTITILHQALNRAKIDRSEKVRALKRLAQVETAVAASCGSSR